MSTKTPAIISAVLTVIFLILFVVLFLFVQMIALNGASEQQGVMAMGLSLICQGIGVILAAMLAWRLTDLLIGKFNWNAIPAVIIAIIAGTFGGGLLAFLSVIAAIPIAGIR
jgi:membrane protease YdiL (CAAX protease family)